jgi:hypothetical protein
MTKLSVGNDHNCLRNSPGRNMLTCSYAASSVGQRMMLEFEVDTMFAKELFEMRFASALRLHDVFLS